MPLILVIDDDTTVRTTIRVLLERAGYEIVEAGDGKEASRMLDGVDLVITDLLMPEVDGVDLIALIRDGRSFGVYFVITASLTNDVPNKLFNLLSQRLTFTMSDPGEYTTVVGRGWPRFNDTPGRGLAVMTL